MTALNFFLSKAGVSVVADTLVTANAEPAYFTSKVFPVPHWNGLICGRGSLGLILDWVGQAYGGMLAFDMIHADQFVPDTLRRLYSERPPEEKTDCTTSVYHLGYNPTDGAFCGFAYKSVNDFESEPLGYGIHCKPGVEIELELNQFPADFVTLMRQQRLEQDLLPANERCFVGGQVLSWTMHLIAREGMDPLVETLIAPVYEWDDYTAMYMNCADRLYNDRISQIVINP